MKIRLGDFNQNAMIAGFKRVRISDVDQFLQSIRNAVAADVCVQFFDSSLIAGVEHLHFAVLNALNAFKGKANISANVGMETLLYASARRQIKEAVKSMGIKNTTSRIAVLVLAESGEQVSKALRVVSKLLGGKRDDSVIDLTDAKREKLMKFFNISKTELEARTQSQRLEREALTDLVIEHMALIVTQR